jgi:hypothetical protein
MIEVLTQYVPGIQYGDEVELELNSDEIQIAFA